MRVIYTAYSTAEERARMSPRTGFELIPLSPISESPKLTMIVPPMQSNTPISFTQLNFSPKNARESRKVKRLEEVLKIVFDVTVVYFSERLKVSCARNQNGHINRLTFATLVRLQRPLASSWL
uniref:Uncharacterized protein n=1 Tax=Opuntia streptacantha TaxID=393608 RepID=A0A7C8Z8F0_OPUST